MSSRTNGNDAGGSNDHALLAKETPIIERFDHFRWIFVSDYLDLQNNKTNMLVISSSQKASEKSRRKFGRDWTLAGHSEQKSDALTTELLVNPSGEQGLDGI